MDIKMLATPLLNNGEKIIEERIKEIEIEKIVEKPVERIIEKPVYIEKEKIVERKVPDIQTDRLYEQLANLNSRNEETKQLVKSLLDQIKYIASDPNRLKNIQNDIKDEFENVETLINDIKPEVIRSIEKVKIDTINLLHKIESEVKPQSVKNYDGDFKILVQLVQGIRGELTTLNKLNDMITYFAVLKKSIDGIIVNPQVKVTTESVDVSPIVNQIAELNTIVNDTKSSLLSHYKESEFKLDSIKSVLEPNTVFLKQTLSDFGDKIEDISHNIFDTILNSIRESNIESIVSEKVIQDNEKLVEKIKEVLSNYKLEISQKFDNKMLGFKEEIERQFNQKIFDLSLDVNNTISSVIKNDVRKALDSYLLNFKLNVDVPDNSLSLLSMINESVSKNIESIKEQPRKFIVDSESNLPKDLTNYVGCSIIVKKVSFWKRNVVFICDGNSWKRI